MLITPRLFWRRWAIGLEFKPANLWIGVYWRDGRHNLVDRPVDVWICLVPMFPIHIIYQAEFRP